MSSFPPVQQVTLDIAMSLDSNDLIPSPIEFCWEKDVYVATGSFEVAGNATDTTLNMPSLSSVQAVIFSDDASSTATSLTLKVNGSSNAREVQPVLGLTDAITSLTVSNSSSTERRLLWFAITEYTRQ